MWPKEQTDSNALKRFVAYRLPRPAFHISLYLAPPLSE